MKALAFIFFILLNFASNAQHTVKGIVTSMVDGKPIIAASVFISNTSIGTVTLDDGSFQLYNINLQRFDLVISALGYETYTQTLQTDKPIGLLTIQVKPKVKELEGVIVGGYTKETWETWGKFFLENFIGTSSYAEDCSLLNKEVVMFRKYKKTNELKIFADEPLIIENKSLGYRLKYQLELFQYNFSSRILFYQGYPFFEEIKAKNKRQQEKWQNRREEVYSGSIMHFFRSLYRNKLSEQNFEVRRLDKLPNYEQLRVKSLQQKPKINKDGVLVIDASKRFEGYPYDSVTYFNDVLKQPNEKEFIHPALLTGDSIAYAIDSVTGGIFFKNYLHIRNLNKKEPVEYLKQMGLFDKRNATYPISTLELLSEKEIQLLSNGMYYEVTNLLNSGFWAWSEKIATLLPYNYKPIKKPF